MTKKFSLNVTMTEKMINHIRDKKPDHMSRSCYVEEMFWKGVQLENINSGE